MKFVLLLSFMMSLNSFAQAASYDWFKPFAGAYRVSARTCPARDQICANTNSIYVIYEAGKPTIIRELGKDGKTLEETIIQTYGDAKSGFSYAFTYGTPEEIAGWKEAIKNSDQQVVNENTAGIRQTMNQDQNGPLYIYSFGRGHQVFAPESGRTIKSSLREYTLVRDGE